MMVPHCSKHKHPVGFHSKPGGFAVAVCELCDGEAEGIEMLELRNKVIDIQKEKNRKVPYYLTKDLDGFIAYPLHYILFHRFEWYRRFIGGEWEYYQGTWIRMRYAHEPRKNRTL